MSSIFLSGQTLRRPSTLLNDLRFLAESNDLASPVGRLQELASRCDKNPQFSLKNIPLDSAEISRERLPCFVFQGKECGVPLLRIAIFAGVHGDEPDGVHALFQFLRALDHNDDFAVGYQLFCYPICNPTGLQHQRRESIAGIDINREFWKNSQEPEVVFLEKEIRSIEPHGIISLHTDDTSDGFYGYAHGAVLTENLILPALDAVESMIPRNRNKVIDGFPAHESIISKTYPGILSAPPEAFPKPFEIVLETPQKPPVFLKEAALVLSLQTILAEYRQLIAFADNL